LVLNQPLRAARLILIAEPSRNQIISRLAVGGDGLIELGHPLAVLPVRLIRYFLTHKTVMTIAAQPAMTLA